MGSQAQVNHNQLSVSRMRVSRIYLWNCFINIQNSFERNRKRFGVTGRVSEFIGQYQVFPINNILVENVSSDVKLIIKGSSNC